MRSAGRNWGRKESTKGLLSFENALPNCLCSGLGLRGLSLSFAFAFGGKMGYVLELLAVHFTWNKGMCCLCSMMCFSKVVNERVRFQNVIWSAEAWRLAAPCLYFERCGAYHVWNIFQIRLMLRNVYYTCETSAHRKPQPSLVPRHLPHLRCKNTRNWIVTIIGNCGKTLVRWLFVVIFMRGDQP